MFIRMGKENVEKYYYTNETNCFPSAQLRSSFKPFNGAYDAWFVNSSLVKLRTSCKDICAMSSHNDSGVIDAYSESNNRFRNLHDGLGPLPPNWEIAYTQLGEKYFIDHTAGTTHWDDPREKASDVRISPIDRISTTKSTSSLPRGWERVDDPQFGSYYIDHVNRRTQYEKPSNLKTADVSENPFTLDPRELKGELITVHLKKSKSGFGFTLIGADDDAQRDEFLQIKNIVPNSPASLIGALKPGDVLVRVEDEIVLGFKQERIIKLFRNIPVDEVVKLQICRGYPLMLDTKTHKTVAFEEVGVRRASENKLEPEEAETVVVHLVKGETGFGFTITECMHGQMVNTIIDKNRCKDLISGDVLLEINGRNVQHSGHTEIVELLRHIRVGDIVTIVCRRLVRKMPAEQVLKRGSKDGLTDLEIQATEVRIVRQPPQNYVEQNGVIFRHPLQQQSSNLSVNVHRPRVVESEISSPRRRQYSTASEVNPRMAVVPQRYSTLDHQRTSRPLQPIYNKTFDRNQRFYPQRSSATNIAVKPLTPTPSTFSSSTLPAKHRSSSLNRQPNGYLKTQYNGEVEYEFVNTELIRHPDGFGFRVVGSVDELGPVRIDEIVLGGAADVNGLLRVNDELVEIEGRQVLGLATHSQVVNMLTAVGRNNGRIRLRVRRKLADRRNLVDNSRYSAPPTNQPSVYPYDVTIIRGDTEGFGFVILSSLKRKGAIIGEVKSNSPASKCGRLKVGDCVTAVNKINILDMLHGEIVNLIKDSGFSVTLTVSDHDSTYLVPTAALQMLTPTMTPTKDLSSNVNFEYFTVELERGAKGFGFSIRGGREFSNMPLFVLRIADNCSAQLDGRLKVGDQLMEINGVLTNGMSHSEAIELIRRDPVVRLFVRRSTNMHTGNCKNDSQLTDDEENI